MLEVPGDDMVLGKGQQELPAHQVRGVCIRENQAGVVLMQAH